MQFVLSGTFFGLTFQSIGINLIQTDSIMIESSVICAILFYLSQIMLLSFEEKIFHKFFFRLNWCRLKDCQFS